MPITWDEANISPAQLAADPTLSKFTFEEFSLAYELYLLQGKGSRKKYENLFQKDKEKKKKVIQLVMKVKSNKIQQKAEIPLDAKVSVSDIDMIIQEVLFKPKVKIYVD